EVRVRADDLSFRRVAFDDVDLGDEIERFLRLGVFPLLENLPPRVSEASGAHATARLRDGVVAGVLIDDEASGGLAEHLLRRFAASVRRVRVDDELGRDEAPDEGATIEILL